MQCFLYGPIKLQLNSQLNSPSVFFGLYCMCAVYRVWQFILSNSNQMGVFYLCIAMMSFIVRSSKPTIHPPRGRLGGCVYKWLRPLLSAVLMEFLTPLPLHLHLHGTTTTTGEDAACSHWVSMEMYNKFCFCDNSAPLWHKEASDKSPKSEKVMCSRLDLGYSTSNLEFGAEMHSSCWKIFKTRHNNIAVMSM